MRLWKMSQNVITAVASLANLHKVQRCGICRTHLLLSRNSRYLRFFETQEIGSLQFQFLQCFCFLIKPSKLKYAYALVCLAVRNRQWCLKWSLVYFYDCNRVRNTMCANCKWHAKHELINNLGMHVAETRKKLILRNFKLREWITSLWQSGFLMKKNVLF